VNNPACVPNTGVSTEVSGFAVAGRPVRFPPGEIPGLFHTQPSFYQPCLQADQNQHQCGVAAGYADQHGNLGADEACRQSGICVMPVLDLNQ
jgi:hypothetical protein